MPREVVLDASAVLALLQAEPGSDRVAGCLPGSWISAVNLAEVVSKLADAGMPPQPLRQALQGLGLRVAGVDSAAAFTIGLMRPGTKRLGLSLGDRACLTLGQTLELPVLTSDQAWAPLPDVELIR